MTRESTKAPRRNQGKNAKVCPKPNCDVCGVPIFRVYQKHTFKSGITLYCCLRCGSVTIGLVEREVDALCEKVRNRMRVIASNLNEMQLKKKREKDFELATAEFWNGMNEALLLMGRRQEEGP